MLSKAKIKLIHSLTNKKYRELHQLFFVEGSNNVLDFLSSDLKVSEVFATEEWLNLNNTVTKDLPAHCISTAEMKKITALSTPSEVLAIFKLPDFSKKENQFQSSLKLVLDDIRDPGNLGTIIRTADWFGIREIICSNTTTDAFSPKVVQASMGSLSRVAITYTELPLYFDQLPARIPVYGALLEGTPLSEIQHQGDGIILIGSEAHGINPGLFPFITHRITIPAGPIAPAGKAESLNASIATAIICYELSKTKF